MKDMVWHLMCHEYGRDISVVYYRDKVSAELQLKKFKEDGCWKGPLPKVVLAPRSAGG